MRIMEKRRKSCKERICALLLALALVLTGIMPGSAATVEAAEAADVYISVIDADNNNALLTEDITIKIFSNGLQVGDPITKPVADGEHKDTYQVSGLTAEEEYTYIVEKEGYTYKDSTAERKFIPTETGPNEVDAEMQMEEIKVDVSSVELYVRDTKQITINNPIKDADYTWNSNNDRVVTVNNGMLTAKGEGTATVTVSCGLSEPTEIVVNVKKVRPELTLTATPNEGNDVTSVTLTVGGLEQYMTDDDKRITGGFTFYAGDEIIGKDISVNNKTYTYEEENSLIGQITFKVIYSGDDRYEGVEKEAKIASYTKTKKLTFENGINKKTIRDDAESLTFKIPLNSESTGDRSITYSSSDINVANVDSTTGEVTVNKAGKAIITVSAEANENYAADIAEYTVIVQRVINISEKIDDPGWQNYSKIYDKKSDAELTLTLSEDDLAVGTADVKVVFGATVKNQDGRDAVNAGENYSAELKSTEVKIIGTWDGMENIDLSEFYIIENYASESITGRVTIEPRPVYFGTGDVVLEYGQDLHAAVASMKTDSNNQSIIKESENEEINTGILEGDSVDTSDLGVTLDMAIKSNEVTDDEVYEHVILPNIDKQGIVLDNNTNYILYPSDNVEDYGDLTIKQQQFDLDGIFAAININDGEGTGVYKNGHNIYVRGFNEDTFVNGADSSAELRITLKDNTYYDFVMLKVDEEPSPQNLTAVKFPFKSQVITGNVYFERSSDGFQSAPTSGFTIIVDSDSPKITFGDWKESNRIVDNWVDAITFGHYYSKNSIYTIEVTKEDLPENDFSEEGKVNGACGADDVEWSYYILKRQFDNEEGQYKEITADDIKELRNNPSGWTTIDENNKVPFVKDTSGQLEEIAGYYVILVKVSDKVGNSAIYSSNGIVVDIQEPTIIITDINGQAFPDNTFYKEDVPYKVSVIDYEADEDVVSGIKSFDLTVSPENETAKTITMADETEDYSIEGMRGLKTEFTDEVSADKNNSNDVTIKVSALDQANNNKEVTQGLMIDQTKPTITVEFDNNDVHNGKYFNSDRTMTITFKERNFDKDLVLFEFMKTENPSDVYDKNSELVTVDTLRNNGIEVTWDPTGTDAKYVENHSVTEYTDEREIELELKFPANEDTEWYYHIVPYCTDKAGNGNEGVSYGDTKAGIDFAIDNKAPDINVKFAAETNPFEPKTENYFNTYEDGAYSQKRIIATIEITEKNFWVKDENGNNSFIEGQFNFTDTKSVDANKKDIKLGENQESAAEYYKNIAKKSENWGTNEDSDSTSSWINNAFNFNKEANYVFTFTYTDLAGNSATYSPRYFTYDKTAPTGKITVTEDGSKSVGEKFFDLITFNKFSKEDILVEMSGDDLTAGVAKVEAYDLINSSDTPTYDEIKNFKKWTRKGDTTITYSMSPNQQFVPYLKVTDRAGNAEYFSTESGFVADNQEPYINLSCTNLDQAQNGIFKASAGKIEFAATAYDLKNETYSGIDKIWYTVQASGNVVGEPIYVFEADEEKGEKIQNENERDCTFSVPITDAINSNNVIVTAYAQDLAGNVWKDSETVKVDITSPTISVAYNNIPAVNGDYYNATRVATVTVKERNFDPSGVRFNITNTEGVQPSISGWTAHGAVGVSDEAYHTCTVTFAADGDYTFTLNATDLAGNTSNYTRVDEFTIDQTDPTIQVTYDNNNDAEPGYFNASRTATVTINEHNFNAADVNAMITASLQGSGASVPRLGSWSTRGDSHTASVTFSADADYTFDIEYTDMAGNAAADYTQDSFTIDQTAPEIEFFDIEDKSANNGTVAPGVRYSDINYTADGVEITLEGAENGITSIDGTRSSIPNGQSIKMADFAHEEAVDDVYTMTASVTDRAGNTTEQSVMFSVNRFGSNYIMSEATEKLIEDVYTNEEQELVVTEINVDTLVFNGISYGRDGNLVTLEEGADYDVSESGSEESWKRYTYTINKENFETEGNYTVTIESEDRAKNVSSTQTKQVQSPTDEKERYDLNFVVDKTAPTVVITGIEEGGQYRANTREITVNAADNIAMGEVGVYLGNADKPEQTYSAEAIQAAGGEVTYTMSNSNSRQDVRAVAVDAAGNTSETEIRRVLVTSNLFVQFYSNTPLLAGSIAGIVVIAAALWYFLIFKRKKKEEEQENSR